MTTIAYKHGFLAADSRVGSSSGWVSHETAEKVTIMRHPDHGRMFFGFSGDAVEAMAALPFLLRKERYYPQDPKVTFCIMGITADRKIYVWCHGETHTEGEHIRAPFYAIGSGSVPAKAAMMAGAEAEEAVKIAMQLDPNTGGRVHVYDVTDLL